MAQRIKSLPAIKEAWVQSLGQEDSLEKEMATPVLSNSSISNTVHSSILAWEILRTEVPGRL